MNFGVVLSGKFWLFPVLVFVIIVKIYIWMERTEYQGSLTLFNIYFKIWLSLDYYHIFLCLVFFPILAPQVLPLAFLNIEDLVYFRFIFYVFYYLFFCFIFIYTCIYIFKYTHTQIIINVISMWICFRDNIYLSCI